MRSSSGLRLRSSPNSEVVECQGENGLDRVTVRDARTGQRRQLETRALFVFIGASPHTGWLSEQVTKDRHGFLLTGRDVAAGSVALYGQDQPFFLETSLPGVFAVGDVHAGSIKRVASAVGEGSMAVRLAYQRLARPAIAA